MKEYEYSFKVKVIILYIQYCDDKCYIIKKDKVLNIIIKHT